MSNLAEQSYWDKSYENYNLEIAPKKDQVRQWIEKFVPKAHSQASNPSELERIEENMERRLSLPQALEIGCFPGRYLTVLGELGYELNGIDLTPGIERNFVDWLKSRKYKTGEFSKISLSEYRNKNSGIKYDLVCSFGFIEHFIDWKDVLLKHADFVKDEGYLIISAPNFRGILQRILHFCLDNKNYKRHYIPSMNPFLWKKIVQDLDFNFDIIYCGYFGAFEFWVDKQEINSFQKIISIIIIKFLMPILKKLPGNNEIYSPYCGLIAKKRKSDKV
ncbi:MAG: methyltransferase domain-containing protein [bacterium]